MIDGERGVMEPGTCCYINANLTHRVSNRGDCDRIHLVVDCAVDDWLRGLFDRAEIFYFVLRRDSCSRKPRQREQEQEQDKEYEPPGAQTDTLPPRTAIRGSVSY